MAEVKFDYRNKHSSINWGIQEWQEDSVDSANHIRLLEEENDRVENVFYEIYLLASNGGDYGDKDIQKMSEKERIEKIIKLSKKESNQ